MFQELTRSCLGLDDDPMLAATYDEQRFSLRTACKPPVLQALDNLVRLAPRRPPYCAHTQ